MGKVAKVHPSPEIEETATDNAAVKGFKTLESHRGDGVAVTDGATVPETLSSTTEVPNTPLALAPATKIPYEAPSLAEGGREADTSAMEAADVAKNLGYHAIPVLPERARATANQDGTAVLPRTSTSAKKKMEVIGIKEPLWSVVVFLSVVGLLVVFGALVVFTWCYVHFIFTPGRILGFISRQVRKLLGRKKEGAVDTTPLLAKEGDSTGKPGTKTLQQLKTKKPEMLLGWATEESHFFGLPRACVVCFLNFLAVVYTKVLNRTKVLNEERLLELVGNRQPGTALITISNHMSVLDDVFLWGLWELKPWDPRNKRWALSAKDMCFFHPFIGYLCRLAQCMPLDRGAGVEQPCMEEARWRLRNGQWVHLFPEGNISQSHAPLKRLKWGLASLICKMAQEEESQGQHQNMGGMATSVEGPHSAVDVPITSVQILCIGHSGFEKIMPEPKGFGKRTFAPLWFQNCSIVVGEPFTFDVQQLKKEFARQLPLSHGPATTALSGVASSASTALTSSASTTGGLTSLMSSMSGRYANGAQDEVTKAVYTHIADVARKKLWEVVEKAHQVVDGTGY